MLDTILQNLITNAIKFTGEEVRFTIQTEKHDNIMFVTVEDSGVGIPQHKIGGFFTRKGKKSSRGTSKDRGKGWGILSCKEFVERHNGKIWVESKLNIGSKFIFYIPDLQK